jgi:tRNA-specific 2-thiouridylase
MSDNENNELDLSGKTVVVGMTGRVDSTVAAFLLKKQKMKVIGLSIITSSEEYLTTKEFFPKCHILDLDKVKAACENLSIPFYATDAKQLYEEFVVDPFVANRILGRANNTCYDCTRLRIKVLYEKMKKLGADYIATGHYGKVYKNVAANEYYIQSNNDTKSDQSFLLSSIDTDHFKHLLLPLGELKKDDVKRIAQNFGLINEQSQSRKYFCLQEEKENKRLIENKIPPSLVKQGQVIDKNSGSFFGDHEGVIHHFIGQNELAFSENYRIKPEYEIVDYDHAKAELYIGEPSTLTFNGVQIKQLVLIDSVDKSRPQVVFVKFKHHKQFMKADIYFKNNRTAYLAFTNEVYPLVTEEHIALFDREGRNAKVIGRGVVAKRGSFKLKDRVKQFKVGEEDENSKGSSEENDENQETRVSTRDTLFNF